MPYKSTSLTLLSLFLIASAWLLVGCASTPSPTPTISPSMTPKPTFTTLPPSATPEPPSATPIPPSATPTATVAPSATPTPEPSATPAPTDTATPQPSPTPTTAPTRQIAAAEAAKPAPPPTQPPAPAASAGNIAAKPAGSSLFYEPEFAGVAPAGPPPTYGGNINPLTGQTVADAGLVNRRPILVRYGNDRAARPHAGIAQADMVMEDLMEAFWITRLTGVFLQNEPKQVGPVRSARPVNIELLPAFDGVFVFSGASIGVNQLLARHSFDLIHEGHQGDLFFRSSQRPAPHNLYTSIPAVRERIRALGWERAVSFRGLSFGAEAPAGAPASRVHIPLPPTSTVVWTWDADAGVYRRWVQGEPYTDLLTGEQIGAQNVIVIYAKHWKSDIVEDSLGSRAIGIAVRGGERAQVFRDGRLIEGYWWRDDPTLFFQLVDANGRHIPLKPGQSWVQIVPTSYQLGIQ